MTDPNTVRRMKELSLSQTRYTSASPPPSIEAAEQRVGEIDLVDETIKAQLANTTAQDFVDDVSFRSWKNRAASALGYVRRERKFLWQWIAANQPAKPHPFSPRNAQLEIIFQGIKKRAENLATELRKDFQPKYSSEHQPADVPSARNRMNELTAVRMRLQGYFTELTGAFTSHPLERSRLVSVKLPLQAILSEMEAETAALRIFIQTQPSLPSSKGGDDWKQFLVQLVDRALSSGLQLTPEERQRFDLIAAHYRPSIPNES